MGLSDGAFFMIKHTPLPNGNHPISSPVCPMGVADTLELISFDIDSDSEFYAYLICKLPSTKTVEGYQNNPDLHILYQNIVPMHWFYNSHAAIIAIQSYIHSWRNM